MSKCVHYCQCLRKKKGQAQQTIVKRGVKKDDNETAMNSSVSLDIFCHIRILLPEEEQIKCLKKMRDK
jgi:hypothetical protein